MSKFLTFEKLQKHQKEEYEVKNKKNNDVLGYIFIYAPWKKWVFESAYDEIVYDAECLRDIAEFMEKLK